MADTDKFSRNDRALLVHHLVTVMDGMQKMLDILMPDVPEGTCVHPPDAIEHEESMDDEDHPYRCTKCGAEQLEPFHSGV